MPSIALYVGDAPWFLNLSVLQSPDHLKRFFFFFKESTAVPLPEIWDLVGLRCGLGFGGLKKKIPR